MIWRLLKSSFGKSRRDHAGPMHQNKQECQVHDKPQLVEKGYYFGRPVRIYSDGSLKAATREGWIRFSSFAEFSSFFEARRLPEHGLDDGEEAATR